MQDFKTKSHKRTCAILLIHLTSKMALVICILEQYHQAMERPSQLYSTHEVILRSISTTICKEQDEAHI